MLTICIWCFKNNLSCFYLPWDLRNVTTFQYSFKCHNVTVASWYPASGNKGGGLRMPSWVKWSLYRVLLGRDKTTIHLWNFCLPLSSSWAVSSPQDWRLFSHPTTPLLDAHISPQLQHQELPSFWIYLPLHPRYVKKDPGPVSLLLQLPGGQYESEKDGCEKESKSHA
jgi:hypothetical protein